MLLDYSPFEGVVGLFHNSHHKQVHSRSNFQLCKKKNHSLVRKRGSPHLNGSPHQLRQSPHLSLSALNSKEAKLFACNQQTPQICGFLLGLANGKDPQQTGKIVYVGEGGSLAPFRLPSGYPISGSQSQVEASYLCARGAVLPGTA